MTRILNIVFKVTMVAIPVALILCLYTSWVERAFPPDHVCKECPEPQPRIEDHVAEVMRQECPACPDCPTWQALQRAGVEIICTDAFGEVPRVNYWPVDMPMGCSKVKRIVVDKNIEVVRR